MKAWILFLSFIIIAWLTSCAPITKLTTWGSVSTQAVPEIHEYALKTTKLPAGTIPSNSVRILIGTETELIFNWPKSTELKEYDLQLDPIVFGTSDDSTTYNIPDSSVTYNEVETLNASASFPELSLSAGEYQIQLKNSIWSTWNNAPVWSKYSNAVGLYVDHTTDPLIAPAQLIIEIK